MATDASARAADALAALRAQLTTPVDAASLAAFRVLFGGLVALAALRFLARGWVTTLLVAPAFHFTYDGFGWVRPWPAPFMHLHFVALAIVAAAMAVGLWYRTAAVLTFAGFTYVELIDKALYLNHYYLVSLLAGMLALLPVGRALSLDARRRPDRRVGQVPAWMLHALRLQVAVVYLYAGLTKLDADWLLRAQPLRIWLHARSDLPIVGPLLESTVAAYAGAWLGAAFDLAIVPLLLWRRTRWLAFAAVVAFHGATAVLFNVGMFPWLMIASATLFLPPGWPRALAARLRARVPAVASTPTPVHPVARTVARTHLAVAALLGAHLALQILLPARQYLDGERSAWTYRGFNFAWNVMIAEKTGDVTFTIDDPARGRTTLAPGAPALTPVQAAAMAQDPDMIRAYARHLRHLAATARAGAEGSASPIRVRADAFAALNGAPRRRLVDPTEDLTAEAH